jgi:hypothetical protein
MRKICLLLVFSTTILPLFGGGGQNNGQKTDSEIWNEGVDSYTSGDVTNALSVMRLLMNSRTHGARAAEVVAKLEYDAARAEGSTNVLERLEKAARAAQIALRAAPDDKRLNDNFSLAVADIPELRERKRMDELLASAQNVSPVQLLKEAVVESRDLISGFEDLIVASTNDADKAVSTADAFGSRGEKLADKWILLKESISKSVTNQNEQAEIFRYVEELHKRTVDAARKLSDLDADAERDLAAAEGGFTEFYKNVVPPPEAMNEVVQSLSNACDNVAAECGRPWLNESLDYTKAFRSKFPEWAKQQEMMAQADTNKPPFTAEVQARISDLAEKLERTQEECVKNPSSDKRREALEAAVEISRLLPKDNNRDNSNDNNKRQDKKNNDGKSDQNRQNGQNKDDKDNSGEDKADGKKDNQPENEESEKNDRENEANERKGEAREKESEMKEIEALLKRAQERSDEHEADKKARMRSMRLPSNERDW